MVAGSSGPRTTDLPGPPGGRGPVEQRHMPHPLSPGAQSPFSQEREFQKSEDLTKDTEPEEAAGIHPHTCPFPQHPKGIHSSPHRPLTGTGGVGPATLPLMRPTGNSLEPGRGPTLLSREPSVPRANTVPHNARDPRRQA